MTIKTPNQLNALAKETAHLALMVCVRTAFAQCERERVKAYSRPLLESFKRHFEFGDACKDFLSDSRRVIALERETKPEDIQDTGDLYKLAGTKRNEAFLKDFYDELAEEHIAHGWKGNREHCPALVAESAQRDAERALVDAWFRAIGQDPSEVWNLEHRKRMLEIAMGACINTCPEVFERVGNL